MRVKWSCSRCGAHGTTSIETRQIWHRCVLPERPKRRVRLPEPEGITREEARSQVWDGLADALDARDPDWNLRRPA